MLVEIRSGGMTLCDYMEFRTVTHIINIMGRIYVSLLPRSWKSVVLNVNSSLVHTFRAGNLVYSLKGFRLLNFQES